MNEIKKVLQFLISFPVRCIDYIQYSFIRMDREHSNFYRLDSTKRDENGDIIIIYKTSYTGKLLQYKLKKLVSGREDILSGFDIKDLKTIISLANKNYNTNIEVLEKTESKILLLLSSLFVAAFLVSNIAASKIGIIYGIPVTGAVFIRPFVYIFGNIITEIYGYKKIRVVIWGAVVCNLFMVIALYSAILIPKSSIWNHQSDYQTVLGSVPRIVVASIIAFFTGEFINAYVLAKIKLWTGGKRLFFRVITSSFLGTLIDTTLFVFIAYSFVFSMDNFLLLTMRIYLTKVFKEIICYPIIRYVCKKVKKYEKIDIYDINTKFTPFSLDNTYNEADNFWNKARVKLN